MANGGSAVYTRKDASIALKYTVRSILKHVFTRANFTRRIYGQYRMRDPASVRLADSSVNVGYAFSEEYLNLEPVGRPEDQETTRRVQSFLM